MLGKTIAQGIFVHGSDANTGVPDGTWTKVLTAHDTLYSTTDLTAGSSTLATGRLYFVYE